MKKIVTVSIICLLFHGYTESLRGQELSSQQKARIERQVDSVFHSMVKASENLEFDKLSQGVDDSFHAGFIANNSYYSNYDSLVNLVKLRSKGLSKQSVTILKEKITALSESIVLLTAYGDASIELNGGNAFNVKFYWSFVYHKADNNWKVIQSHQSNVR